MLFKSAQLQRRLFFIFCHVHAHPLPHFPAEIISVQTEARVRKGEFTCTAGHSDRHHCTVSSFTPNPPASTASFFRAFSGVPGATGAGGGPGGRAGSAPLPVQEQLCACCLLLDSQQRQGWWRGGSRCSQRATSQPACWRTWCETSCALSDSV